MNNLLYKSFNYLDLNKNRDTSNNDNSVYTNM